MEGSWKVLGRPLENHRKTTSETGIIISLPQNIPKYQFMRKLLLIFTTIILLGTILQGCSVSGLYLLSLNEVHRPEDTKIRYGEYKIEKNLVKDSLYYVYEDELINISWDFFPAGFYFTLENKSEHSIKLLWDDAAYVNTAGITKRLIHSAVKFVDKEKPQVPVVIPDHSILKEKIYPADNVEYVLLFSGYTLVIWPIIPNEAESKKALIKMSKEHIGKTIRVVLPLQVQDVVNEYDFYFLIEDIIISRGRW